MSGPQVYFSWPTAFTTPDPQPHALPPPIKERSFRSPFGIDKDLFNYVLRPEVPVVFALCYVVTVFSVNAYNRSRGNKPWWISRTRLFKFLVIVHNVLLALYSFATFAAILRALAHTWPGLNNPNGAAGIADAFCKINGPRGMGDATTFNTTLNIWEVKNTAIRLGYDGNPDPTDVGRLWNEGLAFWGWIFYMSKFYEVVDTMIILAKGKRSATLQTYHHAGAMLCMWAGIRYMSPPILIFVVFNSGIHGMMYTYYTLAAMGIRVPRSLKRTLTILQITQFVVGGSLAAVPLFIQYDIPIATSYQVATTIRRVVSSVSSAATSMTSELSKVIASPTATAVLGPLFKKLLLRAAGEEGVAERIHDSHGDLTTPHMEEKIQYFNEQTHETKWRTDWTKVQCLDTTGQVFAVYLNLFYLAPLTGLFARFFFKAYTQRGQPKSSRRLSSSLRQAEKQTRQAIEQAGEDAEDAMAKRGSDAAERVRKETNYLHEQLRDDVKRMKEGSVRGDRRVSDRVASFERQVKSSAEKVKEEGKNLVDGSRSPQSKKGSPGKSGPQKGQSGVKEEDESAIEDEPEKEMKQEKDTDQKPHVQTPHEQTQKTGTSGNAKSKHGGEQKQTATDEDATRLDTASIRGGAAGHDQTKAGASEGRSPPGSDANNQGEQREGLNTANPQGTREGARDETGDGKTSQAPSPEQTNTNNEPEAVQDDNMAKSQAIRPGTDGEGDNAKPSDDANDTDAMGKSGSIIDLNKEKAGEARESAEPPGSPRKRPGNMGTPNGGKESMLPRPSSARRH